MLSSAVRVEDDDGYERFLSSVRERFDEVTKNTAHLFTTDATDLFPLFLAGLPEHRRQHYTCTSCRHFIERFGGLVFIDEHGCSRSALWSIGPTPEFFVESVARMQREVNRANVTGVFKTDAKVWGEPVTGVWKHLAVTPAASLLCKRTPLATPSQIAAEKREEYGMLHRGLADFPIDVVRQAKALLESDALYRSEKCLGVAKWLLDLHERLAATKNKQARENIVWLAVASAPVGFAHVRSTMIGTLLEDIAAGLDFADVSRKFADKMHPLQYQRPTALPSDGQIAQAEKVMAALKSAGALERRFARLEDLQTLWRPVVKDEPASGGVFGHLKSKARGPQNIDAPATTMTWVKFQRDVLPKAERIELAVPHVRSPFAAFVTAANPDAPNMLQWDNPVSWYVYTGGSFATAWNVSGEFCDVTAVALLPTMWNGEDKFAHQGKGVTFILKGARDTNYTASGGMFPETMRSEYHGIRHTLEAHFRSAIIADKFEASACGLMLRSGQPWDATFRVTANGVRTMYRLDRWD